MLPIASLRNPKTKASGNAKIIVARCPISCRIKAGPAAIILGKAGPASTPNIRC